MKQFFRITRLFVALYGAGVALFLIVRALVGEPTPVALINRFLPLILMPALILLPVCLLRRHVRAALLLIPAVWTFGIYFAPLFLPNEAAPGRMPSLTLATYNLGARATEIEPLLETIQTIDADILGLQEVSQEAAQMIAQALARQYPHRALHPNKSPYMGYGLLSKYPILNDYAYPIQPGRLRLQRTQIEFEGRPVTVFNFHAQPITESWRPPDVMVRRRQVHKLVDEAARIKGPRVLLGDFNLNEQSIDYEHITAHFSDAFYQAGWGMGFTNPVWGNLENPAISRRWLALVPPHRRIDFIFHDAHFQAVDACVWPESGGSDHLPLIARLARVAE